MSDDAKPTAESSCAKGDCQKRKKGSGRDWVSVSIAILALLISGGTAYWSTVRQQDNFRVAITGLPPTAMLDPKTHQIVVDQNQTLALMNSGNRPVALTDIELVIDQSGQQINDETTVRDGLCFRPTGQHKLLAISKEAFVISPASVVTKQVLFQGTKVDRANNFNIQDVNDDVQINFCLAFHIVTPNYQLDRQLYLSSWDAYLPETGKKSVYVTSSKQDPIYTILERSGTIFSGLYSE
jgi:hypothetical protein